MKEKVDIYKEYCAGCGLCHSAEAVQYEYKNGFFKPELQQNNFSFCEGVCPASGNWLKNIDPTSVQMKHFQCIVHKPKCSIQTQVVILKVLMIISSAVAELR